FWGLLTGRRFTSVPLRSGACLTWSSWTLSGTALKRQGWSNAISGQPSPERFPITAVLQKKHLCCCVVARILVSMGGMKRLLQQTNGLNEKISRIYTCYYD
ncbi:hypothetical protein Q2317_25615, partial [Escherichia coli]|nr:hypothetical protein [Escherichia coli]